MAKQKLAKQKRVVKLKRAALLCSQADIDLLETVLLCFPRYTPGISDKQLLDAKIMLERLEALSRVIKFIPD